MAIPESKIKIPLDNAVILIPEKPSKTESYAAGELKTYLEKISGKKVQVERDSNESGLLGKYRLSVGKTKLAEQLVDKFNAIRRKWKGNPTKLEELKDSFIINIDSKSAIMVGGITGEKPCFLLFFNMRWASA